MPPRRETGRGRPSSPVKKRKKKEQAEQPQEMTPSQSVEEQVEQPVKKKKKQRAEQSEDFNQQPVEEQVEQPVKKRKKKEQAEQPQDGMQDGAPTLVEEQQPEQPVKKRKKKEQAEQPADQTQQPTEQTTGQPQSEQSTAGQVPPDVTQYLSDTRSVDQLSDEELEQRAKSGRDLSRMKGLSDDTRRRLADEGKKARAEALARQQGKKGKGDQGQPEIGEAPKGDQMPGDGQAGQPTDQAAQPNPDKKQVQQLDGNKSSPEAENKARAYLDDGRSADQLSDDELRDRLEGMRDLMAGNELSRDSERALRRKLRAERDILRNRVAKKVVVEEKQDDQLPGQQRRRDRDQGKWDNWAERDILRDRRRSEDLEEGELRRRIDIYRVAIYDDRYDDEERGYWRDMMERDRRYLSDSPGERPGRARALLARPARPQRPRYRDQHRSERRPRAAGIGVHGRDRRRGA